MSAPIDERREYYSRWDLEELIRQNLSVNDNAIIEWTDNTCVITWLPEHEIAVLECECGCESDT